MFKIVILKNITVSHHLCLGPRQFSHFILPNIFTIAYMYIMEHKLMFIILIILFEIMCIILIIL